MRCLPVPARKLAGLRRAAAVRPGGSRRGGYRARLLRAAAAAARVRYRLMLPQPRRRAAAVATRAGGATRRTGDAARPPEGRAPATRAGRRLLLQAQQGSVAVEGVPARRQLGLAAAARAGHRLLLQARQGGSGAAALVAAAAVAAKRCRPRAQPLLGALADRGGPGVGPPVRRRRAAVAGSQVRTAQRHRARWGARVPRRLRSAGGRRKGARPRRARRERRSRSSAHSLCSYFRPLHSSSMDDGC